MDLVTIIVITYNSRETIMETLNSIYDQTYRSIELIVSDDCSTDDTVKLAEEWMSDHRDKFICASVLKDKTNRGIPANINKALRVAKGDYIQVLAADDLLTNDGLEKRMYFAKQNPKGVVLTRLRYIGDNVDAPKIEKEYCSYVYSHFAKDRQTQFKDIIKAIHIIPLSVGPIQRSVYNKIGLYDERFKLDEDWIFFIKLYKYGIPLVYYPDITAIYRVRDDSLSHGWGERYLHCQKLLFKKVRKAYMLKYHMYYDILFTTIRYSYIDCIMRGEKAGIKYNVLRMMMLCLQPKVAIRLFADRFLQKGD